MCTMNTLLEVSRDKIGGLGRSVWQSLGPAASGGWLENVQGPDKTDGCTSALINK